MSTLSEYEKKRLENIKANEALLRELELPGKKELKPVKPKLKPKPKVKEPVAPSRVSARIRGKEPEKLKIDDDLRWVKKPKYINKIEEMDGEDQKKFLGAVQELQVPNTVPTIKREIEPKQLETYEALKKSLNGMEIRHDWGTVKVTTSRITNCLFHPSNTKILGCASDTEGLIGFWDINSQDENEEPVTYKYRPHKRTVTNMQFNPVDNSKLLSSSYDGTIKIFDMNTAKFDTMEMGSHKYPITGFDMSSDGHNAWFTTSDGELGFVDTRAKKEAIVHTVKNKKVGCIHINPVHQHLVALSSNDRTCTIWDLRMFDKSDDMEPLQSLKHGFSVTSSYWSPNGDILATTAYDDFIRLFDLNNEKTLDLKAVIKHNCQTGRWVTTLRARWNANTVYGLNNQHLVVGNMKHSVDIISGETGEKMASLYDSDHITAIPSVVQFHPSTATPVILTGNGSGRMVCWS